MNNMKIFQDGLIKVYQNDRQEQLVDARELHEKLKSKRDFSNWITDRIEKYDFIENIDFKYRRSSKSRICTYIRCCKRNSYGRK